MNMSLLEVKKCVAEELDSLLGTYQKNGFGFFITSDLWETALFSRALATKRFGREPRGIGLSFDLPSVAKNVGVNNRGETLNFVSYDNGLSKEDIFDILAQWRFMQANNDLFNEASFRWVVIK